jgi:hypothetical protein
MSSADRVDLLCQFFRLEGETVVRISNGEPISPKPARKSYAQVSFKVGGKLVVERLHRVKFALAHGYLPTVVDHRSRDHKDDSFGNLRPATKSQNAVNQIGTRCPGIRRRKSGRWGVHVNKDGRQFHCGTYVCFGVAARAAKAVRRNMHGEFVASRG